MLIRPPRYGRRLLTRAGAPWARYFRDNQGILREQSVAFEASGVMTAGYLMSRISSAAMIAAGTMTADYVVTGGGLSPFSADHVDGFTTSPGSGTAFNWTARSMGDEPVGSDVRYIVAEIGVVRSGTNTFGDVYIGGVLATQIGTTISTTNIIIGMFAAIVPTGTTGDVTVNVGSSSLCCTVSLVRMINPTSITPADTANDTVSPVSLTLDIPSGGAALAFTQAIDGVSATWANATKDYEVDARTNEWFSSAISTTSGTGVAISATGAATGVVGMAASFS